MIHYVKVHPIIDLLFNKRLRLAKFFNQIYTPPVRMEFYLGTKESVTESANFSKENRQKHNYFQCGCQLALVNHFSGCRCNIFDRVICTQHHEFHCGKISTGACKEVRKSNELYWLIEASKELGVSVDELERRNLPENKLHTAILSITDEIDNANRHKFLREHPGWQGFGSPPNYNRDKPKAWKCRRLNDFIYASCLNY